MLEIIADAGAVLLTGLDPETPEALLQIAGSLGNVDTGIDEGLLGPRVMHLRYDPDKATRANAPAYFTTDTFPLHTDVSYVATPPAYLLMHCVTPAPCGGGACLLANCNLAAKRLDEESLARLSEPIFRFAYPPNCRAGHSPPQAIRAPEFWRFKSGSMIIPNSASAAVSRFHAALRAESVMLPLGAGDMLIIDNNRLAHGRTAFEPTPPGFPGRHMLRTYAASTAVHIS